MEIIIGREPNSSRLSLTIDGKETLYGNSGCVPQSVGTKHCQLAYSDKVIQLKNLDINNYSFVNGQAVEVKTVTQNDRIELGTDHYHLDWRVLATIGPADIRPLKPIWEEYENQNINLQIAERKFNTLRSMTGLITMVAIVLSIMTGGRSPWFIVLYALAILVSLLFFVKAYRDASSIPQKRQELTKKFQREYVCPHCGHFLNNQSYEIIAQNTNCPYCKTRFIH